VVSVTRVLEGRPRDLGGFGVRRVLPAPGLQTVGPFIFFDHMGPATFAPGEGVDVRPHPHIGLATVTYLFEGAFMHRDSLGTEQLIRPGDVNWMVAGRGIVHSERTPPEAREAPGGARVHGIQTWIALPRAHEEIAPSFEHHPAATLPEIRAGGASLRAYRSLTISQPPGRRQRRNSAAARPGSATNDRLHSTTTRSNDAAGRGRASLTPWIRGG